MLSIDLNCDMGEGMPFDEVLMPLISSANIACGGHAGDADSMRQTVELALKHEVRIGAHPSYPDRENFGRKDLIDSSIQAETLKAIIIEQVFQLEKICTEFGTSLHHIKPHGALYNRAVNDATVSYLLCSAIKDINPSLVLYGLSGSKMKMAAEASGIVFVNEAFADRTYQDDGQLTPRTDSDALIENGEQSLQQVMGIIKNGSVITANGNMISIQAETICLHSDGKKAVDLARLINSALKIENIRIGPPALNK